MASNPSARRILCGKGLRFPGYTRANVEIRRLSTSGCFVKSQTHLLSANFLPCGSCKGFSARLFCFSQHAQESVASNPIGAPTASFFAKVCWPQHTHVYPFTSEGFQLQVVFLISHWRFFSFDILPWGLRTRSPLYLVVHESFTRLWPPTLLACLPSTSFGTRDCCFPEARIF